MTSALTFISTTTPGVFLSNTSRNAIFNPLASRVGVHRIYTRRISVQPRFRKFTPLVSAEKERSSDQESSGLPERPKKPDQTFFGLRLRTNGDVLKFGVIATIVPFGIKALLQATGTPDLLAGQLTTGFVSVFALLAWVSTYVFRVGTKQMTYAQQLRDYEDKVIQKRYEELTDEELTALKEELNDEA